MNLSICMLIFSIVVCLSAATSAAPQLRQRNEKQVQEELRKYRDLIDFYRQTHRTFEMWLTAARGATIEEVVLQSNLYIKPKSQTVNVRRVRSALTEEEALNAIYATHKRVKRQFGGGFGGGFGGPNGGFGGNRGYGGFGGNGGFGGYGGFGGNGGFGAENGAVGGGNTQAGTSAGVGGTSSGVNVGAGPDGGNAAAHVNLGQLEPLGPNGGINQEQTASNGVANSNFNDGFDSGSSAASGQAQGFQSQSANGSFGASSASTATQSQSQNPFGSNNAAGASLSQVYKLPNGQTINFSSANNFANGGFGNTGASRGSAVSVTG